MTSPLGLKNYFYRLIAAALSASLVFPAPVFALRPEHSTQKPAIEVALRGPQSGMEEAAHEAAAIFERWSEVLNPVFDPDDSTNQFYVVIDPSLVKEFAPEFRLLNQVLPKIVGRAFLRVYTVASSEPIVFLGGRVAPQPHDLHISRFRTMLICLTSDEDSSLLEAIHREGEEWVVHRTSQQVEENLSELLGHLFKGLLGEISPEQETEARRLAHLLVQMANSPSVVEAPVQAEQTVEAALRKIFPQGHKTVSVDVELHDSQKAYRLHPSPVVEGDAGEYTYLIQVESGQEHHPGIASSLAAMMSGEDLTEEAVVFHLNRGDDDEPLSEEESREFARYQVCLVEPGYSVRNEDWIPLRADESGVIQLSFPLAQYGLAENHVHTLRFHIRRDDTQPSEQLFAPPGTPESHILDLPDLALTLTGGPRLGAGLEESKKRVRSIVAIGAALIGAAWLAVSDSQLPPIPQNRTIPIYQDFRSSSQIGGLSCDQQDDGRFYVTGWTEYDANQKQFPRGIFHLRFKRPPTLNPNQTVQVTARWAQNVESMRVEGRTILEKQDKSWMAEVPAKTVIDPLHPERLSIQFQVEPRTPANAPYSFRHYPNIRQIEENEWEMQWAADVEVTVPKTAPSSGLEERRDILDVLREPGNTDPVSAPLVERAGHLYVDSESVESYYSYLWHKMGIRELLIAGKTAETDVMDVRLRQNVIQEMTLMAVRHGFSVLTHVTGFTVQETLENARIAQQAGAQALVVAPLAILDRPQDKAAMTELIRQIHGIGLPVLLYDNPAIANGQLLDLEWVRELWELGLIVGAKDSTGILERFKILLAIDPDFIASQGDESLIEASKRLGIGRTAAVRSVGSSGSFWPVINQLAREKDVEKPQSAQSTIHQHLAILRAGGNIPAAKKYILWKLGVIRSKLTAPRTPSLTAEQQFNLDTFVRQQTLIPASGGLEEAGTLPIQEFAPLATNNFGSAGLEEPFRILVVEDTPADFEMVKFILERAASNFEILRAWNVAEALDIVERARNGGRPVRAVITDIQLEKESNGIALAEKLNPAGESLWRTPVFVQSTGLGVPLGKDERALEVLQQQGRVMGYGPKYPDDKVYNQFLDAARKIPVPPASFSAATNQISVIDRIADFAVLSHTIGKVSSRTPTSPTPKETVKKYLRGEIGLNEVDARSQEARALLIAAWYVAARQLDETAVVELEQMLLDGAEPSSDVDQQAAATYRLSEFFSHVSIDPSTAWVIGEDLLQMYPELRGLRGLHPQLVLAEGDLRQPENLVKRLHDQNIINLVVFDSTVESWSGAVEHVNDHYNGHDHPVSLDARPIHEANLFRCLQSLLGDVPGDLEQVERDLQIRLDMPVAVSAGLEQEPEQIVAQMLEGQRLQPGEVMVQSGESAISVLAQAGTRTTLPNHLFGHYDVMPSSAGYIVLAKDRSAVFTSLMHENRYAKNPGQCGIVFYSTIVEKVQDWLPSTWRVDDSTSKVPVLNVAEKISSVEHLAMLLAAADLRQSKILEVQHLRAYTVKFEGVEYTLLRAA